MGFDINTGALIIVIGYLIGMLLIGFVVGRIKIKTSRDYMIAGRRMGLFMVAFSLSANNIGGGSTTGLADKAFGSWGMSAIWYVLAASVAMIPLAYFAPKIRKTMAITIPEVVGRRFGKGSSIFSAVLNIVALFCLTSSQVAASGSVVATLTGIPMNVCLIIAGVVKQFYTDVLWGDLDVLLIDMPPGTGDVALTIMQSLPVSGVLMVSTPQPMVSMIVSKAIHMCEQMKVPVYGVIENMAYLECPNCQERIDFYNKEELNSFVQETNCNLYATLPMLDLIRDINTYQDYTDNQKEIVLDLIDQAADSLLKDLQ